MAVHPSMLAFFTLLSISALVKVASAQPTFCDIFPFRPICRNRFPPTIVSPPPPPPPSTICLILPLFCSTTPPPPPPIFGVSPPPPPPGTGVSVTTTFISGTLTCPINSQLPRFTLLTNALVDLRCTGILGSTATVSLATTVTNGAGNYFISLDANASSQFNPNTCVLAITAPQPNVCLPATQISNVPLRVLTVDQGVVFVTSPLFG